MKNKIILIFAILMFTLISGCENNMEFDEEYNINNEQRHVVDSSDNEKQSEKNVPYFVKGKIKEFLYASDNYYSGYSSSKVMYWSALIEVNNQELWIYIPDSVLDDVSVGDTLDLYVNSENKLTFAGLNPKHG